MPLQQANMRQISTRLYLRIFKRVLLAYGSLRALLDIPLEAGLGGKTGFLVGFV